AVHMSASVIEAGLASTSDALVLTLSKLRDVTHSSLFERGYALIRGLWVTSPARLETICKLWFSSIISDNGEHNRSQFSPSVYSPVPYSSRLRLLWHNEDSFNAR